MYMATGRNSLDLGILLSLTLGLHKLWLSPGWRAAMPVEAADQPQSLRTTADARHFRCFDRARSGALQVSARRSVRGAPTRAFLIAIAIKNAQRFAAEHVCAHLWTTLSGFEYLRPIQTNPYQSLLQQAFTTSCDSAPWVCVETTLSGSASTS